MALVSGVDLVLELPLFYATGSAELFAEGAVTILDKLGVVDAICFGTECGDADLLMEIAQILVEEPDWYRLRLQQYLKEGLSFPSARAAALPEYAAVLDSPNNILGIEYCKALIRLHSGMKPVAITRKGSRYHDEALYQDDTMDIVLPSATAIRAKLAADTTINSSSCSAPSPNTSFDLADYIPASAYAIFKDELEHRSSITEDDFSPVLLYQLLQASSPEDYTLYADISSELAARMFKCRTQFQSFSQFADLLKTKELTRTRINRALLHLVLQIKKEDKAYYARILGFQKKAGPLLSQIKEQTQIPLLSKTADAKELLNDAQYRIFEKTIESSMLYEGINALKNQSVMVHEYQKPIVIV